MKAVAVVSIIAAVATIVVLVAYLTTLAVILARVNARVGTLIATLREVAAGTEPIGDTVEALEVQLRRMSAALGRFAPGGEPPPGPDGADRVTRS